MERMRKPISWILRATLVLVIVFVGYNLLRDRDTVTVEQATAPPASAIAQTLEKIETPVRKGSFSGANDYSVTGTASIVDTGGEKVLVFSDDFKSTLGPDLQVYISKSEGIEDGLGEFVSLQSLKNTNGTQTYTLPDDSDDFKTIVIWCRAFNAAFGSAQLN